MRQYSLIISILLINHKRYFIIVPLKDPNITIKAFKILENVTFISNVE